MFPGAKMEVVEQKKGEGEDNRPDEENAVVVFQQL